MVYGVLLLSLVSFCSQMLQVRYVAASTHLRLLPFDLITIQTGVIYIQYFIIQPISCTLNHFAFMGSESWTCRDQESELSDHE